MFRRLVIISSIVVALAGTAALGQGQQGQQGQGPNRALRGGGLAGQLRDRAAGRRDAVADRVLERAQQKLNLTDAQINGIRALQENRRRETEALQKEIEPKRQALRQLLRQPNPNANEVGNATLALKETRERMRDINQRFSSGLKGLLTADQLQKLPKRAR